MKILLVFFFLVLSLLHAETNMENKNSGIVLSFDDYFPDAWEKTFDLFDKYNTRVTFFVQLKSPSPFCFTAQNRGHEIGYHTINHPDLRRLTREEFFAETIAGINLFREQGIELTSFAYPLGFYQEWMHNALLKHYKIVRSFRVSSSVYKINEMTRRFVYSKSIDNITYRSTDRFQNVITQLLNSAKANPGTVVLLTSHNIGNGDWEITAERLEFILKKANELNLTFYTFRDLQQ